MFLNAIAVSLPKHLGEGKKNEDEGSQEEAKEPHQGKISRKELRKIKAERREKWRIKKATREKKQKGEGKEKTGTKGRND